LGFKELAQLRRRFELWNGLQFLGRGCERMERKPIMRLA
jgi:hypothetical protein